jgi:hypothetical protein
MKTFIDIQAYHSPPIIRAGPSAICGVSSRTYDKVAEKLVCMRQVVNWMR